MTELQTFVEKLQQRLGVIPEHEPQERLETVLKGRAIELWSDAQGERFWLVADKADAARLGKPRGTTYTAAEGRRIVALRDSEVVAEIQDWKWRFEGLVNSK